MNYKNLPYRLIIEIIGILIIIFLFWYNHTTKLKAERFKDNYATEHKDSNKQHNEYLTKSEYKEYYKQELDSIKKYIKGIKTKNIQNITKIYNYYIDSSKTIYTAPQLNDSIFDISYSNKCWGFTGLFNISNHKVNILNKKFIDNYDIIDYWQRRNLWNIKLFPHWGHKEYYRKTIFNCKNDSIRVEKINIIKAKEFNNYKNK